MGAEGIYVSEMITGEMINLTNQQCFWSELETPFWAQIIYSDANLASSRNLP